MQVFSRYLQPGGEENSVARIAAHLELAGHEVIRFWRASEEWTSPSAPPRWRQLFLTWNNPAVLRELRELHERTKPDAWILHNVVPVVSLGIYRLARELGVPVIQWLHNYRPISPSGTLRAGKENLQPDDPDLVWKEILAGSWRGIFLTAWLALGYSQVKSRGDFAAVKAWVAVSNDMKNAFARAGFPPDKLHVLKHSWDIRPPLRPDSDDGYFLFLGRMVEEKGVRFLVELWRRPELQNVQLVMAGDGPLAEELRGRAPKNIRWVGFVRGEEKHKLVAGARAILFPCLWSEPLTTVVYEAFEQGRPVIASDIGGLKDLIADGMTGKLLPPADEKIWLATMQQFARDAELSRAMGRRGLEWLNQNVSPSVWGAQFEEILQRVLR